MSDIQRSRQVTEGDTIVNEGDIIITNSNKGIVMEDNVGDMDRVKVVDDDGVKTIVIEEVSP